MLSLFKKINAYCKDNTGIAAVEFALVAPSLVLMMVGAIDFGMYLNYQIKMENSARAAVEYVLQGGSINNIESDVITAENMSLTEDQMEELDITAEYVCECESGEEVSCSSENACNDPGDYMRQFISVEFTYGYNTIAPYPGLPETMNIKGKLRVHAP